MPKKVEQIIEHLVIYMSNNMKIGVNYNYDGE